LLLLSIKLANGSLALQEKDMEDNVVFISAQPIRARMRARMSLWDRFREPVYHRLATSFSPLIRPLSLHACRRLGEIDGKYRQDEEVVHIRAHS